MPLDPRLRPPLPVLRFADYPASYPSSYPAVQLTQQPATGPIIDPGNPSAWLEKNQIFQRSKLNSPLIGLWIKTKSLVVPPLASGSNTGSAFMAFLSTVLTVEDDPFILLKIKMGGTVFGNTANATAAIGIAKNVELSTVAAPTPVTSVEFLLYSATRSSEANLQNSLDFSPIGGMLFAKGEKLALGISIDTNAQIGRNVVIYYAFQKFKVYE